MTRIDKIIEKLQAELKQMAELAPTVTPAADTDIDTAWNDGYITGIETALEIALATNGRE